MINRDTHIISNNEDLLCFANYCMDIVGGGFHWDNAFSDYCDKDGEQSFNNHKCLMLDERLEEAINFNAELFQKVIILLAEAHLSPSDNFIIGGSE